MGFFFLFSFRAFPVPFSAPPTSLSFTTCLDLDASCCVSLPSSSHRSSPIHPFHCHCHCHFHFHNAQRTTHYVQHDTPSNTHTDIHILHCSRSHQHAGHRIPFPNIQSILHSNIRPPIDSVSRCSPRAVRVNRLLSLLLLLLPLLTP
ncbi:hypothetical protein BDZ94DRAFT_1264012 [Collybia nuda]|uniref:Uncharacterized protein n=1 Tax=Collybia nuda TaxID=64659 RepID=A0A9P6CI09_9AGAR|nr:hypothetical protein BDZ94DRAFT_1264012 [Collybia nuda]